MENTAGAQTPSQGPHRADEDPHGALLLEPLVVRRGERADAPARLPLLAGAGGAGFRAEEAVETGVDAGVEEALQGDVGARHY